MDDTKAKEEVSLLSEFYTDTHDDNSLPTPPPEFDHLKDEESRLTRTQTTLGCLKYLLGQLLSWILSVFVAFIPSFIPRYGSSKIDAELDRRLSPTAYLDGLRGIACFIVFWVHFAVNWFPILNNTYGETQHDVYFFQLPLIRVLLGGSSAVATFFVISGYALSYRALSKIYSGNKAEVLDTLSSSTFRRCIRLYLPCAANTFICGILQYYGLFTADILRWNTNPPRLPTMSTQFWDWWGHQQVLMYPFIFVEGSPYSPPYNGHLWTIPLEIRGSFVVYGTVLAVAKLSPFWRMAILVGWDGYLYYMGKWDLFLFVSGIVLANLDVPRHLAAKKSNQETIPKGEVFLPTDEPSMTQMTIETPCYQNVWSKAMAFKRNHSAKIRRVINPVRKVLRSIAPYMLFIIALYFLSFPHVPYGVDFMYWCVPDSFNHISGFFGKKAQGIRIIGSVLMAFCLSLSPSSPSPTADPTLSRPSLFRRLFNSLRNFNLQWLFTNTFSQYLGRISFGFYLMHGPVLFCIGTKFLNPAWVEWEQDHDTGAYFRKFMVAAVVNLIAVFWVADVFARVVDERSVRWASILAKFMSRKAKAISGTGT